MRFYQTDTGYKYKEYKKGKKVRISDKEYYKVTKQSNIKMIVGGSKSPSSNNGNNGLVFVRHSEDGTTAKIYTTYLNGKKVIFKVFNELNEHLQLKEALLQQEACNIFKSKQAELHREFKRLIGGMTITDMKKKNEIESNMPTAIIPEILDYGNYEELNGKYGGNIPNENGSSVGFVIIMEYIAENTVFQDLQEKNISKIELYKKWSRRSDVDEVDVVDVNNLTISNQIKIEQEADNQYSMQYSYLTNLLVSVLNILNKYNISHNDAQFKNVMVKFTEDGKIEYLYLIDFGQVEKSPHEIGHDYQFSLFNMAEVLRNAKRWWPDLY